MKNIEIITERLTLKPLGTEHFQTTKEYAMDYENTKYMCHFPKETNEEIFAFLADAESEWKKENPKYYEFAIFLKNEHIGAASIYFENDAGELGWIINKKYWGKGFAYEAAKTIVEYFSTNMKVTHFTAHCGTKNIDSYKTMEKLGMTKIGECGSRRNRAAKEDSFEYLYEVII